VKRILIVRSDKIGDVLLTFPMVKVIHNTLPQAKVILAVRDYTRPLTDLYPEIDEVIEIYPALSVFQIANEFKKTSADAIFTPASTFPLALAAYLSAIPIRVGTGYRWYSFLFNKKIYEHRKTAEFNEAEYNIRMLGAIGIEVPEAPLPDLYLQNTTSPSTPAYAVLHLRTGGSAPLWSEEKYIELAKWLHTKKGLEIVLTGESMDSEFLLTVAEELKLAEVPVHIQTSLTLIELAQLLKNAALVVAGSTGPGHLAASLGTRTIGLFPLARALSRGRWGFRGKFVKNLEPLKPPFEACPMCKGCTCIETIAVEQVMAAVEEL
jgi:ADP-heptose:LPS heptosyltransferase